MKPEYTMKKGIPYPFGVSAQEGAVNIVVTFPHSPKKNCGIIVYTADHKTWRIPFCDKFRIGMMYCVRLENFRYHTFSYEFFIDEEKLSDPYARNIIGREKWGKGSSQQRRVLAVFRQENAPEGWEDDVMPAVPYEDSVIYGLHVRGFTKHPSSGVAYRGTFEGVIEKIPYLQELGITAIECMPCYEFDEIIYNRNYQKPPKELAVFAQQSLQWEQRINYWGFSDDGNYYFTPKYAYGAGTDPVLSLKKMVQALHQHGIECIMQIYFAANKKPGFILEVLRYWMETFHIDGFHLLGSKLPMELLGSDPMLASVKLIVENTCADKVYEGQKQPPEFKNLAVYRDDFRADSRRFLKGDEDLLYKMAEHMRQGSEWEATINHITDYRGFTLMDLVSYDCKHNEGNGEENRDGSDYNYSWNCGAEGPSRKKAVQQLRLSQRKNALSLLLLSQAVPFILSGDECGHSAGGNNNAYCQDNKVNWLNWKPDKNGEALLAFTKELIAFRREHPILHSHRLMRLMDYESCGYPDLSYHGEQAWYARFENYNRHLGMMYCGMYEKKADGSADDFIYIAMNMHWITHEFALPILPPDFAWKPAYSTREVRQSAGELCADGTKMIEVPPRSIMVLTGKRLTENKPARRKNIERKSDESITAL